MATHDYSIANQSGAAFRTDLNNALAAIQSNNDNSSSPATTVAYQWWADTNTAIMKIRNSNNNAWIKLFTLAGGIDVESASTFKEDVTFDGATAGRDIVFDRSDNALEFADNAKAKFGAGGDLEIFHNGSNSIIADTGTGNLILQTSKININNAAGSEALLHATEDGSVELYYNGNLKLDTQADGVKIHDSVLEIADTSCHIDLMETATTNHRIRNGSGNFHIQRISDDKNTTTTQFLIDGGTGAVELYHEGTKQMETTSLGVSIRDNHKFESGSSLTNTRVFQSSNGICIRPNISGAGTNNAQGTFIRASANCSDIDDNDTVKFIVFGTGDVQNANNSYAAMSDVNLKQDIVDAGSQWDDIKNLRVRKYRFKNNPTGALQIGCIAQEVETISAGLIETDPEEGFKSLKYSVLYMKAIKCLQEAMAKIEVLETEVAALKTA